MFDSASCLFCSPQLVVDAVWAKTEDSRRPCGGHTYDASWIVETISLVVDDRLSVLLRLHTTRQRLFALFFARLLASRLPPAPAWLVAMGQDQVLARTVRGDTLTH